MAHDVLIEDKLDYIGDILGMNNLALTLKQSVGIGAQDQNEVLCYSHYYSIFLMKNIVVRKMNQGIGSPPL